MTRALPAHLFVSESGDLFDTRRPEWHKHPPLREGYSRTHREIRTGRDLRATLRAGGAAWPGGYTVALYTNDGDMASIPGLSLDRSALRNALEDIRTKAPWRIVGADLYDEGPDVQCVYTADTIASSYGDLDGPGGFNVDDFDGLRVSDLSEVPDDYTGEVLHVNDHGNMTLYACTDGECSEVWSVV